MQSRKDYYLSKFSSKINFHQSIVLTNKQERRSVLNKIPESGNTSTERRIRDSSIKSKEPKSNAIVSKRTSNESRLNPYAKKF
mmetsp:Transcript_6944/g.7847  ORF Transcript_6944/g.7847 Transcript_6944/m.7847 type:complete len:83 (+) Transcript_6944:909-1157(+)